MADLLDLVADDVESGAIIEFERGAVMPFDDNVANEPEASQTSSQSFKGVSMVGRVGSGRHGDKHQRALLGLHMRGQKQARRSHNSIQTVLKTMKGSTLKKNGKSFQLGAKKKGSGGVVISLTQIGQKGNRFTRRIPWAHFLESAYSKYASNCNVAIAARLEIHPATVPKLQKTCAIQGMFFQIKMLRHLLHYCLKNRPASAAKILN